MDLIRSLVRLAGFSMVIFGRVLIVIGKSLREGPSSDAIDRALEENEGDFGR